MSRRYFPRRIDWLFNGAEGEPWPWDDIRTGLLMEIRDELRALNGLLNCGNFLGIPRTLRTIRDRLPVPRKRRRRRKAKR